jgi:hypothetical protein
MARIGKDELERLYDAQMAKMATNPWWYIEVSADVLTFVVTIFMEQKERVVPMAAGMEIGEGNIPFLPVVTGNRLYHVFDVDVGNSSLGISPNDAREAHDKHGRSVLSAPEAIALGIYTDVLSKYSLWAPGTHYPDGRVAHIMLMTGGGGWIPDGPMVGWCLANIKHDKTGTPSCRFRS